MAEMNVEEIIETIAEKLREAPGDHIAYIAQQAGITAKYLGDNQFEVRD